MIVKCANCGTKYETTQTSLKCPSCGSFETVEDLAKKDLVKLKVEEEKNRINREIINNQKRNIYYKTFAIIAVVVCMLLYTNYSINKPIDGLSRSERINILENAEKNYKEMNYEDAVNELKRIPEESSQYKKAKTLLEKIEKEYVSDCVAIAESNYKNNDLNLAVKDLRRGLDLFPDNKLLDDLYDKYYREYSSNVINTSISESNTYWENSEYESAIKILENAINEIGQSQELYSLLDDYKEKYTKIQVDQIINNAEQLKESAGLEEAIIELQNNLNKFQDNFALKSLLEKYYDEYVNVSLEKARLNYIEYNYDSIKKSEAIIETALKIVDDNRLSEAFQYYKEKEPYIAYDHIENINLLQKKGTISSDFGKDFNNVIHVQKSQYMGVGPYSYVSYTPSLDYNFSKVTGTVLLDPKAKNSGIEINVSITGQTVPGNYEFDTSLWSGTLSKNILYENFEFEAGDYSAIQFTVGDNASTTESYFMISDLYFWK